MREQARQLAALLRQMANENRLLLLCALLEGPKTVGELAALVPDITGPALSQHLHKLREGGLVRSQKEAQFVRYSIADPHLAALMDVLRQEYCPDYPADKKSN